MKRKIVLYVLLSLYFFIAIGEVSYNAIKIHQEVKVWYFLSDTQKRQLLIGDLYTSFLYIEKHSPPNATIVIVSKDVRAFFFGKYYLYPRNIQVFSSEKTMKYQQVAPQYIASLGIPLHLQKYKLVGTEFLQQTKETISLYKKL